MLILADSCFNQIIPPSFWQEVNECILMQTKSKAWFYIIQVECNSCRLDKVKQIRFQLFNYYNSVLFFPQHKGYLHHSGQKQATVVSQIKVHCFLWVVDELLRRGHCHRQIDRQTGSACLQIS